MTNFDKKLQIMTKMTNFDQNYNFKVYIKIQIFIINPNLRKKSECWSKVEILIESRDFPEIKNDD